MKDRMSAKLWDWSASNDRRDHASEVSIECGGVAGV